MNNTLKRYLITIGIWTVVGILATVWDYVWSKRGIQPPSATRAELLLLFLLIERVDDKLGD